MSSMATVHHEKLVEIFYALEHYKLRLKRFMENEDIKGRFSESMFNDISDEIKLIERIESVFKPKIDQNEDFDYTSSRPFWKHFPPGSHDIIVYSLHRYKDDLMELRNRFGCSFPRAPLTFKKIDEKIEVIEEVLDYRIMRKKP